MLNCSVGRSRRRTLSEAIEGSPSRSDYAAAPFRAKSQREKLPGRRRPASVRTHLSQEENFATLSEAHSLTCVPGTAALKPDPNGHRCVYHDQERKNARPTTSVSA